MTARDLSTNKGVIKFDFTMGNNLLPDSIIWKKYEDGNLVCAKTLPFFIQNTNFHFSFNDTLYAALHEYQYELWYGNNLLKKASRVCCGDFYILNGQSNAESTMQNESCANDYNPFIRTFGYAAENAINMQWAIAKGDGNANQIGHIGQLGIAIGANLVTKMQVPVCILNGATGGKEIIYFLKDEMNPTNKATSYGRLLTRAKEAEADEKIRAIIWYQGENDAYAGNSYEHYLTRMHTLYYSWKKDYHTVERIYIVQIKQGCKQDIMATGGIQQAQLDFSSAHSDVSILSTANIAHYADNCHFPYLQGYKIIGDKLCKMIHHFQYGSPYNLGIYSVEVMEAKRIGPTRLHLKIKNANSTFPDEEIKQNFYLNRSKQNPIGFQVKRDSLELTFLNEIALDESISYNGHTGVSLSNHPDSVGQGLLCFYQMKIDALPSTPASVDCEVGQECFLIKSNYKTNLTGTFQLYSSSGQLIRQENMMIFEGKNSFTLQMPSEDVYIIRLHITTPDGLITKHYKYTN